jgi:hypothetical protein
MFIKWLYDDLGFCVFHQLIQKHNRNYKKKKNPKKCKNLLATTQCRCKYVPISDDVCRC